MQIAQVVPDVRTSGEGVFDYAIPPEVLPMIKVGILVDIPFHGRKIEGIVVKLKSKSQISNLKSIISIIDPIPVIDETHIKLAEWMSDYYLAPFNKTLFENIVPPAKRTIKKIDEKINRKIITPAKVRKSIEKILIIDEFSKRLKFYLSAMNKTIASNKQVIILVPDLSLIPYFAKYIKAPKAILHAGLTKTERWLAWNDIRNGKIKIILGSQSALFSPVKNIGLIIIDQEENETYKNDRSPRFSSVKVAKKLSQITGSNLILGSLCPNIEDLKKEYQIIGSTHLKSHISIIDMATETGIISNSLQQQIVMSLSNKQKIQLVFNRKGEGNKFSCADCGWIAVCEKCGLPLVPQEANNVCYHCDKSYKPPVTCPKCRSVNIKAMGLGTAKLESIIRKLFPKSRIIQVEKDKTVNLKSDWDIAITTSYGLKFPWPTIGLTAVIDADQGLNLPDFNSPQKTFQTLYKFLRLANTGIIQTHNPENYVIKSLANLNYKDFINQELVERKKFSFPPFTNLVRLVYKNSDLEIVKIETEEIYRKLIEFGKPNVNISDPFPCFREKERNKYRWQITIKSEKHISNYSSLIPILSNLPTGWLVDVDPISLI